MTDQLRFLEDITVHCFTCPHAVTGETPGHAHDLMETHYQEAHAALIAALVGRWT